MAKDKLAQSIAQEDADRAAALRRAEQHQESLAAENKANRMERIENAQGATPETVKVKITKFGAGKVSTGEHIAGTGDVMAEHNDVMEVAHKIAAALEKTGLAEIV